ncbi:MAG: hypothetical protein ABJA61_07340 [Caldimonas sp.]
MATAQPKPNQVAIRKRVRGRTIDGLNAARMRPARATWFMLCVGNKHCLAYLAPTVGSTHKTLLRGLMGTDTGLKYHRGRCLFETGYYVFVGPTVAAGMRQKLERGLADLTGRKWRTKMRRAAVPEGRQGSGAELPQ